MTISRAQMRTQLKGGAMKKTMKKKGGGELLSMLSPAYALSKSLKSGKAEGILGMGLLGAAYNKSRKGKGASGSADTPASNMAAKTKAMKKGGMARGDGCCMKGKTKGTMR
ncbi:hypothetical protein N9Q05_01545 [bacterium]|nr:hypothetical protein [bacterium]